MKNFFLEQMDMIYLFYGLVFFLLAAVGILLIKTRHYGKTQWRYFALFAIAHGTVEWLDLIKIFNNEIPLIYGVRQGLTVLSFLFLLEFTLTNTLILTKINLKKWVYPCVSVLLLVGYLNYGFLGLTIFARYFLGCVGGILAAVVLFKGEKYYVGRSVLFLKMTAVFFGLYSLTQSVAPAALFFPASFLNYDNFFAVVGIPIPALRSLLIFLGVTVFWLHWYSLDKNVSKSKSYAVLSILFLVLLPAVLSLGWVYTNYLGKNAFDKVKQVVIEKAELGAFLIDIESIKLLTGASADENSEAFKKVKADLIAIRQSGPHFRFSCLLGMKGKDVIFLADAESPESEDYSPPGQVYEEVPKEVFTVFAKGQGIFMGPFDDRWGRWYSAFFPVRDLKTKEILAVLEIDKDAEQFLKVSQSERLAGLILTIVICSLLLSFFTIHILRKEAAAVISDAEQDKLLSEQKYQEIVDRLPETILEFGLNGDITFMNDHGLKLLGYTMAELEKKVNYQNLLVVGDRERAKVDLKRISKGESVGYLEYTAQKKDGTPMDVLVQIYPVILNAQPSGFRGIAIDMTERKKAEERLRELSQAVTQSPISISIVDISGNIEYVNPKFEQVTGYSYKEVVGKNPRILKSGHTSPEEYQELWETIISGKEWRGTFLNKKKNGELFWEAASITSIKNSKGDVVSYLAVKEDITERKKLEDTLSTHLADLEKFKKATINRELRMIELKREINKLHKEMGKADVHDLSFLDKDSQF